MMGRAEMRWRDLRQRWKMPSQALMCERKALPSPWPSDAPLTKPAISTTLRYAGTLLEGIFRKKRNLLEYLEKKLDKI
jgi:hypothetical protein